MMCGTALTAQPPPPQEGRKTVTVLFCDLVGSTALGERLDSESLREVMDRYFTEMRRVVERHGGIVEKYIGDAIMAVFGLPRAHEDDGIRALHAASEMGTALFGLNTELERSWGVVLSNRTGINTGEVVVGDPSSGQRLATGDTVNVAARLEQAAPVGQVLIGTTTHRLVKDAVQVEAVEPLVLKGKSEAMPAFRVIKVARGLPGVARRLDAPMVGREQELSSLLEAFRQSLEERTCHLVTVFGEAGVGKSRLVAEAVERLQTRGRVLHGRCLSYGEGITFWPLAEILREAAAITEADSQDAARSKVSALLEEVEEGGTISERLASVMGIASTSYPIEEIFWATRRTLEALAQERPLVVIIEDIHWAEPTFLDLLEHVVDLFKQAPILVLCSARPELLEERPEWMRNKVNTTAISLEALSDDESEVLVDNLLGASGLEGEGLSRITEASRGNPLFVEQIVSMWVDEGSLRRENGRWLPAGDIATFAIPPTISALLSARLDRLVQEERTVIAGASVIGQLFYRGAVEELCPFGLAPEVAARLQELTSKQFIRPDLSSFDTEQAFAFRHVLIRDAAYQAILKRTRAELHERFASWLQKVAGERVGEYEEIVGYHLEQAYRHFQELGRNDDHIEEVGRRAARHLSSAGTRALGRGDMVGAANLLERAASLLPQDDLDRAVLLPDLAVALTEAGQFQRAEAVLGDALEVAERGGYEVVRAYARLEDINLRVLSDPEGMFTEGLHQAELAISLFERVGDERGLAKAWNVAGHSHCDLGSTTVAEQAWWEAAKHAEAAGDQRELAEALSWLALATRFGPIPVARGIDVCDIVLERAGSDQKVQAYVFDARCVLEAMLGKFSRARETARQARALYADLGLKVMGANLPQNAGFVEMLAGDAVAAEAQFRHGYELLEQMDEKGYLSTVAAHLAYALYAQERYDEAEKYTYISERAAASDDMLTHMLWRGVRAKLAARRGDTERAEKWGREGVELGKKSEWINECALVLTDLAEVLLLGDRAYEALPIIQEAIQLYERKGNLVSAIKAGKMLEELTSKTTGT
jgi:class 3 adenylate cyclase/tetratricopeptide (TPR) repeat protein